MPEPKHNEVVSEEALRRGISDQDSQDSKSHNSQKQVASNDDGGNGADGVGSSSSGSSSQPREVSWSSTSLYHGELPDSASSLQPDEPVNMMDQGSSASNEETPATETSEDAAVSVSNQQLTIPLFDSTTHSDRTQDQLVGEGLERATVPSRRGPANGQYATTIQEYMDHTTITAEASRNIGVAAKAKDLNTSLLTSDETKKLEPMAELPPINDNFYPNDGPGIQGVNINNGMLMLSSWNGDMVDGSNQSICVILSPGLNLSPGGGIDSSCDVYVSNADNDLMHLG